VSDRLLVDKSATVGAINKLEKLGYVERCRDDKDKRYHRIFLTERGRAIREELESVVSEALANLLAGFSDDEKRLSLEVMRRMSENIVRATRGLNGR
jgi:DNA-binding MarR family transcriptional regulator